jgi:hypothetical protein
LVALALTSKETWAVLNLRDPEAVLRTLDDALRSFERGGGVPVGVRELLLEFSETLAESTPYEAGLLSGPELVLARERAARGIEGLRDDRRAVQCRKAKRALGGLRQMYASHARVPAGNPVEPFWLRRRERPVEEEVQRLLAKVKVDQRLGNGSRTLLREPVVIVRGVHLADFELLDQKGRRLGSAIPADEQTASGHWRRSYDFRDQDDHSLLLLRDASPKQTSGFFANWTYEVRDPEGRRVVSVHHESRHYESRQRGACSIVLDSGQIGTMRRGRKRCLLLLEDQAGQHVARVLLGYKRLVGWPLRIDLVVEIEAVAPDRLRAVALAASMIADGRVIEYASA